MTPRYSIIIPVFNRPNEIAELLESLTFQRFKNFEVVIVEDGSTISSEPVYVKYAEKLRIKYLYKANSGPGPSRNFGFENASGEFLVVFDSDCIIPPDYFNAVETAMASSSVKIDAWGGPDRGSENFTPVQQAMAYTMSSSLTTGGIRGGLSKGFQPRSFNMGISRKVFETTKGFQLDRLAEDIELSIRMDNLGFKVVLIPDAWVFHKRRTDLHQFFRQVSGFGRGRVQVGRVHPGAIKITHWFPALFFCGLFALPFLFFFSVPLGIVGVSGYILYLTLIGIGGWLQTNSMIVGVLSIPSAFVQLNGYGSGFLKEMFKGGL